MTEEQYQKALKGMTKYCEKVECGAGSMDYDLYLTFCDILDRLPITRDELYKQTVERLYG